jgi:hypothetical protein
MKKVKVFSYTDDKDGNMMQVMSNVLAHLENGMKLGFYKKPDLRLNRLHKGIYN